MCQVLMLILKDFKKLILAMRQLCYIYWSHKKQSGVLKETPWKFSQNNICPNIISQKLF